MIPVELRLRGRGQALVFLAALTRVNRPQVERLPPLLTRGVRYSREGGEVWQDARATYRRRKGDCKDLACWLAAEYQNGGRRCAVDLVRTGARMWHAVVRLESGVIVDPSTILGMGS